MLAVFVESKIMVKQIMETHDPVGREINVRNLFWIIRDIIHRATSSPASISDNRDQVEGKDAHETTVALFKILSSYSWDTKLVLPLAALAVKYGELGLVSQFCSSNKLAKSVALLKQLPQDLLDPEQEPDGLKHLIKGILDMTEVILALRELPSQHIVITPETPVMRTALGYIPLAVYWTIRCVVACASTIIGLTGMGHELSYMYTEETRKQKGYQQLARLIETPTLDNITVLEALIRAKKDQLPLIDCSTKKMVGLGELRKKKVLLLISDLDLSRREILILEQIFEESRAEPTSPFEVVWFPVLRVDKTTPLTETQFRDNLAMMKSWYSVHPPSLDSSVVIRYIKEVWHFSKRPMLVVLDSKGAVVHKNALPMIWIWRARALPFTSLREVTLWQEEAWGTDLMVKATQPMATSWVPEGKYICLYGGEDIEWIRKLTTLARSVAQIARISMEILYVGVRNPTKRIEQIMAIIDAEKLSHMLPDLTSVWLFWVRLESMWLSKLQLGNRIEKDMMMQEIKTMLSLDMCYPGWVMFSRGSAEMVRAKGDTVLDVLNELVQSEERLEPTGFVPALQKHLRRIPTVRPIREELMACQGCGREIDELVRQIL
ncbi:hypothetical protein RJ640_011265 [Escallonia rubra]|uniref:Protein SIEVE ELEMENT OCCLUSION C n=1 Tax=Escallonia rubra TaxID=112253 RepID=A0AA88RKJ9_9ASTE|nr:hypothetical protein RJ640_011265 [Escallonia rubra]